MKNAPLFSVVIIHYNQPKVLYEALDSVLCQDYPRIELIFADDDSTDFDHTGILDYVEKHKCKNLERFELHRNEHNLGTVKNLNKVLDLVQGDYLLFFAADDRLYDGTVLSQFAAKLEQLPADGICVSAQCLMMDENLEKSLNDFTDVNLASALNEGTSQDQFKVLMKTSFYGLGASAFRTEDFEKYGKFDPRYELVEDWSYFLAQTRGGRKVYFSNFYALRHREGGVSHNLSPVEPAYVRTFKEDLLRIRENEILPYLRILPLADQAKILQEYQEIRASFAKTYGSGIRLSQWKIAAMNPALSLRRVLWYLLPRCGKIIRLSSRLFFICYLLWLLTGALGGLFLQTAAGMGMPEGFLLSLISWLVRWGFPVMLCGSALCLIGTGILWLFWKMKKLVSRR